MKVSTDDQNCYNEVFARFYDTLMSEKKYLGWKALITDIVRKYNIPKGVCLDVACGTGRVSGFPAELGFDVIGIDKSACMLEIARKKYPKHVFLQADVRNFMVVNNPAATFAISFYDSLNYLLSEEDMLAMLKSVNKNLVDNAIFLFDMNTREHVFVSQKNSARVFEEKDFYIVFRFGGEGRIWKLFIDIFEKQKDGGYALNRETHIQQGYDESDIAPLLKQSGFKLLEVIKENKVYEDGEDHLSRLYFVVQKMKSV